MRENDRNWSVEDEDTMEIKCIHYGDTSFHMDWFKPIVNRPFFNKPTGGMWCVPIDSEYGWKEWCESEDFHVERLDTWFTFTLKSNKVLVIDSPEDLNKMIWTFSQEYGTRSSHPHFEEMAKIYDAIFLTDSGLDSTRFSEPYDLYGWDCESVLILNPKCVTNVNGGKK